jgi:hypothetical protein
MRSSPDAIGIWKQAVVEIVEVQDGEVVDAALAAAGQ